MEEDKAILHYGYTDLAGQLRSALDQFEGVRQIPFAVILSVIAAYLLVIGPGDYYFLHKVLRRMELTWVTFPATVILFSAGAYYFGVYTKGNAIRVNQATVVDVDVRSGSMRGTAWANVFSPRMQRYDVAFTVEDLSADASPGSDATIGWLGLPGRALGGMNPATPPPAVWAQPYDLHPEGDIAGFPIQTWSSKSLTTRWFGDAPETIECQLQEEGPIPAGTIANRLDFPLENCLLAYGNWVYELGTLEPGRSVRIGPTLPRRELAGFLTGRRLVFDEAAERSRQRATPYDLDSVDVSYILRAMMFFDAAGGRPYARLSHTYQGFVDLSNLLRPDRAVLLAQPVEPLTAAAQAGGAQIHLSIAGTPAIPSEKHTTVYRFVLPVTPKSER